MMKTRYTVVLSMIAGAALGGAAIQGLHAQAKPKAYLVTESEVIDRPSVPPYDPALASAMQAAGGQWIGGAGPTEKITAVTRQSAQALRRHRIREHRQSASLAEVIGPRSDCPETR